MGFGAQTQLADFEVVRLMDGGKWSQEGVQGIYHLPASLIRTHNAMNHIFCFDNIALFMQNTHMAIIISCRSDA